MNAKLYLAAREAATRLSAHHSGTSGTWHLRTARVKNSIRLLTPALLAFSSIQYRAPASKSTRSRMGLPLVVAACRRAVILSDSHGRDARIITTRR